MFLDLSMAVVPAEGTSIATAPQRARAHGADRMYV